MAHYYIPSPPRIVPFPWIQWPPFALLTKSPLHVPRSLHPYSLLWFSSIPFLRKTGRVIILFRRYGWSSRLDRRAQRRETPHIRGRRWEHQVRCLAAHISGWRCPTLPRRHFPYYLFLHSWLLLHRCRRGGVRPCGIQLTSAYEDGNGS